MSTVATLRVMVQNAAAADNETVSSGDVGRLLRSALASDRLATALAVLLAGIILTIAVILLSAVFTDRRRCRLPDKLPDCRCLPVRWRHQKSEGRAANVFTMSCCCCCMDENRHQRKCKPTTDDATATEDVSRNTPTVVTSTLRVSALNAFL